MHFQLGIFLLFILRSQPPKIVAHVNKLKIDILLWIYFMNCKLKWNCIKATIKMKRIFRIFRNLIDKVECIGKRTAPHITQSNLMEYKILFSSLNSIILISSIEKKTIVSTDAFRAQTTFDEWTYKLQHWIRIYRLHMCGWWLCHHNGICVIGYNVDYLVLYPCG